MYIKHYNYLHLIVCLYFSLYCKVLMIPIKINNCHNLYDILICKAECSIFSTVNVILDADTSHPRLIVSDDGKQVTSGNTQTEGEDRGRYRFNYYFGVLGKEGFSSGCFYFEVQVRGQTEWDLGVTRESVDKGLIYLTPENGYWIVGRRDERYRARDSSDYSLSLSVDPERIGVFVDYEKGLIFFYDVKSSSHIYTYTNQSFKEKLYPFVSLGYLRNNNSTPLIICDD